MQDSISREIVVKANKEEVFSTMTDPTKIVLWFPDSIEAGTLEVGKQSLLVFNGGKNKAQVYVEKSVPCEYFSYRWLPGGNDVGDEDVMSRPNTLVEFFIQDHVDGTKVTIKESGFASLPVEISEKCYKDNSGGWDYMIHRLEKISVQK